MPLPQAAKEKSSMPDNIATAGASSASAGLDGRKPLAIGQAQGDLPVTPRYAVIFRTHFWDEFVQRQFDRLLSKVGAGDLYVLVDETNGPVAGIGHDRVVRLTENDVLAMGMARAGEGNLLWFNGDYPLYYFEQTQQSYDYYLQLEYDVVLNMDTDPLIRQAARDKADFVGLTKGEPVPEWAWLHTCRGVYPLEEIQYKLICLSVFSRRALLALGARRIEMAEQLRNSVITAWPFCEGFIATEMAKPGFVSVELTHYAETTAYDFWPPFVESDLPEMMGNPVIHPVLDRDRYIASLLKFKVGMAGYVNVNSLFHRKLRRLPAPEYFKAVGKSFSQKVVRTLRQRRRAA